MIEKKIQLNNGNIIDIKSHRHISPSDLPFDKSELYNGGSCWAYDKGVNGVSSVLDLSSDFDATLSLPNVTTTDWANFKQWRTEAQLEDPTFIALLNNVKSAMHFIWGSFDAGGWGFIHQDGGVKTFLFDGFGSQVQMGTTKYMYGIAIGGVQGTNTPLYRDGLINCVITCLDLGDSHMPYINLWLSYYDESGINRMPYYLALNEPDLQHLNLWWDEYSGTYASNCLSDSKWYDLQFFELPKRPWENDNRYSQAVYSFDYSDIIWGSGWGGSSVEDDDDPYGDTVGNDKNGGDGDFPSDSTPNPANDLDTDIGTDAITSGFVTLYNPTSAQLQTFNNFLWTGITDSIATQIKKLMVNPLDGILFMAVCHVNPPTSQSSEEITFCGIGSGAYAPTIPHVFKTYNCGTITLSKGDTDSFLDYQPYSKAEVYLPSIGYRELDINDVVGSTVKLVYQIDFLSGSCLAQLEFTRGTRKDGDAELDSNVLYEFEGNIYTHIPASATDWRSFYSNMISFAGGALSAGLSGNIGAIAGVAAQGASAVASQQVAVQKSGSVSSSYGYMGCQKALIFITRPNPVIPVSKDRSFKSYEGYTSNKCYRLGDLSGYTEIDEGTLWVGTKTHGFDGITEAEAEMLQSICSSGFYL